jgi:MinD superfamily P-loop ATPase
MGIAAENTGKLVSLVRQEARAVAAQNRCELLLVDGSPGIGCPVIASVTGAHFVLLVSEPTLSAIHDLKRVAELCRHFNVRAGVCINKADLNPELSREVEIQASRLGLPILGRIRYDTAVTKAQVEHKSAVELDQNGAAEDIRELWKRVLSLLRNTEQENKPMPVSASSAR